jgi:hypothetical protein
LSHKSGKRKRHLRRSIIDTSHRVKKYIVLMGGAGRYLAAGSARRVNSP